MSTDDLMREQPPRRIEPEQAKKPDTEAAELAGTRLLRIALDEAVAKIRNWGAEDADEDIAIPVWAGVLPLALGAGPLQPEAGCADRQPQRRRPSSAAEGARR